MSYSDNEVEEAWQTDNLDEVLGLAVELARGVVESRPSGPKTQQYFSSEGSRLHHLGKCKPCAFHHKVGCLSGQACQFCHECPMHEKLRRKRLARQQQRQAQEKKLEKMKLAQINNAGSMRHRGPSPFPAERRRRRTPGDSSSFLNNVSRGIDLGDQVEYDSDYRVVDFPTMIDCMPPKTADADPQVVTGIEGAAHYWRFLDEPTLTPDVFATPADGTKSPQSNGVNIAPDVGLGLTSDGTDRLLLLGLGVSALAVAVSFVCGRSRGQPD